MSEAQKLWRVDVEEHRTWTFYVQGESKEDADEDAAILADDIDPAEWDDIEFGWSITPVRKNHQVHGPLWTGGPHGEWVDELTGVQDD